MQVGDYAIIMVQDALQKEGKVLTGVTSAGSLEHNGVRGNYNTWYTRITFDITSAATVLVYYSLDDVDRLQTVAWNLDGVASPGVFYEHNGKLVRQQQLSYSVVGQDPAMAEEVSGVSQFSMPEGTNTIGLDYSFVAWNTRIYTVEAVVLIVVASPGFISVPTSLDDTPSIVPATRRLLSRFRSTLGGLEIGSELAERPDESPSPSGSTSSIDILDPEVWRDAVPD